MTQGYAGGPLSGLKVVEVGQYGAAPISGMLLGDFGAEVLKIETGRGDPYRHHPPFVDGESYYFMSINRNKRGMTLDLKVPAGVAILHRIIERADVLLENFRPGVMERLGLSYEALCQINPRLIYCSISGYGQTGPLCQEGGYDIIIQGYSGMMSATGEGEGSPVKLVPAVPDMMGALISAFAVASALRVRDTTGRGQYIDVSLLDASLYSLALVYLAHYFGTGTSPVRMGSAHPHIVPMQAFQTKDGAYITTGVTTESMWPPFCGALGLPDLVTDPRFATNLDRVAHRAELIPILMDRIKKLTRAEWLGVFRKAGVPCGSVNTVGEAIEHPQARSRDMLREVLHPKLGSIRVVGIPAKLSTTPGSLRRPPPLLGQHTEEVLRELGYGPEDIRRLAEEKVI